MEGAGQGGDGEKSEINGGLALELNIEKAVPGISRNRLNYSSDAEGWTCRLDNDFNMSLIRMRAYVSSSESL